MTATDKDLDPVSDPKVIFRYLRYAIDFKEPASCTNGTGGFSFESRILDYQSAVPEIVLEISKEDFPNLLYENFAYLDSDNAPLRLSFSVNDVLFLAHGRVQKREERKLRVLVDQPMFKMQRRGAVRIKVMEEHKALVDLKVKKFIPHDLSAGGLSIVMDKEEAGQYPQGLRFSQAHLQFAGRDYKAIVEVTGATRMRKGSDQLWKVGFRFVDLPPSAQDAIAREAYLYTQKIWSRWI